MPFRTRKRGRRAGETTIFFATDLHGSEVCFKKFVASARFYGADLLVLGGDLTGKIVVPVVEQDDGRFRAELHGHEQLLRADAVQEFERRARDQGLYAAQMRTEQYDRYREQPHARDDLFLRLIRERLAGWLRYAHEKLEGTDVRIVTTPGNDDPLVVDEVIREGGDGRVLLMEGEILEVAPGHEMLNTGYSNPTPWNTPREYPEEEIRAHLDEMAQRVSTLECAIFNVHVPPYDSGIDTAPLLDEHLAVRTSMGAPLTAPAGSTAVRDALEEYQPLLSLHGHIHEAAGSTRIGRTLAINAGSEYGEGVLRGVLVTVGNGKLVRYQATTG